MTKKISPARIVIFDRVKQFARNFPNDADGRWGPKTAMKFSGRDHQRK